MSERQANQLVHVPHTPAEGGRAAGDRTVRQGGKPILYEYRLTHQIVLSIGETCSRHGIGDQHDPIGAQAARQHLYSSGMSVHGIGDHFGGHFIGGHYRPKHARLAVMETALGIERVRNMGKIAFQGRAGGLIIGVAVPERNHHALLAEERRDLLCAGQLGSQRYLAHPAPSGFQDSFCPPPMRVNAARPD